ncbi:AAA family ATPase [Photobacterium lutimaris]|uniref:non-specific protein-tyrosine kinase n=1 Tax=Photobacterium lutimaris TaxID=388278 RepID=A0A2T3J2R6_9GAMM|nr:AAA family ATPase [Photobacterium lutimaris]PSU35589.1 exopolysaccharide biosynthesis protein [Photobacterium lutimaris]TDR78642.1 receptor protein-tyrosine kinase [Photobacterium lutimaris]
MSIIENAFDKDSGKTNNARRDDLSESRTNTSQHDDNSLLNKLAAYHERVGVNNKCIKSSTPQKSENIPRHIENISHDVSSKFIQEPTEKVIDSLEQRDKSLVSSEYRSGNEQLKENSYDNVLAKEESHTPSKSTEVKKRLPSEMLYIDLKAFKERGMVSHEDDQANPAITYEYRLVKHKILANIQQMATDELPNSNLLMVTSVNPGEGKTFSAVNMALSIASEKNHTILLVDANIHNPSLCDFLGVDNQIGLIDYLLGDVNDIGDVIYNTNILNLKILPAGAEHHLSNELLASVKMRDLSEELSHRYSDRVIIFDCPSLLGVVETVTVSKLVGQVVVVVQHSKTKLSDIEQVVSELDDELKIGFIVNKTIGGTYSRYGYGYDKKISKT